MPRNYNKMADDAFRRAGIKLSQAAPKAEDDVPVGFKGKIEQSPKGLVVFPQKRAPSGKAAHEEQMRRHALTPEGAAIRQKIVDKSRKEGKLGKPYVRNVKGVSKVSAPAPLLRVKLKKK